MRRQWYFGFILIILVLTLSVIGCERKNEQFKKILTIGVEEGKAEDYKGIEVLIEGFKNSHNQYDVVIKTEKDLNGIKEDIINKHFDVIISSRETFLRFNEQGLTKELTSYFNQNKAQDKFYNITYSYGKISEKLFGMGMFPYSLEFVYNKEILPNELKEVDDLESLKIFIQNSNIKIPVILPEDTNINLAISSIVFNNIIKQNSLLDIYDTEKSEYLQVADINDMFKELNNIVNEFDIDESRVFIGGKDILNKVNNGEFPLALISNRAGENNQYNNIEAISGISMENYKVTPPIMINYIVYATSSSENIEGINKFFDYLIKDDTYYPLVEMGLLTGNKIADSYASGLNATLLRTISQGGIDNIPYYLNLPQKFISPLEKYIENVLNRKYSGDEWTKVVEEAFIQ